MALALSALMLTSACRRSDAIGQRGAGQTATIPPASSSGASTARSSPAPLDAASIAATRDASQKILAPAPASDFDVDQKAAELGPDVDHLFRFVHDDIRHQIYAGVLRGPRGTLTSRAGNAWDRSVLLAALLRHHGREVRFVRGRLTPDRATALVATMFERRPQSPVAGAVDVPSAVAAAARDLSARIEARWQAAQDDVTAALDRSGIALGRTPLVTDATLNAEAADHLWIEYRDGERWVPLDPSAGSAPGETVTSAADSFAEIPEAQHHHVTFRLKAEERKGQVLTEREVLRWSTTASTLHGTSVVLAHAIASTLTGQWRATPTLFVEGQGHAGLPLTAEGVEPSTGASGPGGSLIDEAHRQVGGLGRVNEMFGGSAPPPNATGVLTALWLDVEFTGPSSPSETVRREILDRVGVVARAQGRGGTAPLAPIAVDSGVPVALAGIHACAVTTGPMNPRFTFQRLTSMLGALDGVSASPARSDSAARPDAATIARIAEPLPGLLAAVAQTIRALSDSLVTRSKSTGGTLLLYESTPRLAIVSLDLTLPGLTVDLLRNPLRIVARGAAAPDVVRANLSRGVLDSVIEDAFAGYALPGLATAPVSTIEIFDRARTDRTRIVSVRTAGDVAALTASDTAKVRVTQAIAGHVVVAPERAVTISGAPRSAWFQVDPATGATVGVLETGLHGAQAMPEYTAVGVILRSLIITALTSTSTATMVLYGVLSSALFLVLVQAAGMLGLMGPYFGGFF